MAAPDDVNNPPENENDKPPENTEGTPPEEGGEAVRERPDSLASGKDIHGGRIQDLLIEDELKTSYLTYAMSVIVSRALPDARDGLKPSQRRVLMAMHDLGLGPRSKHRKCAKICGDTSGNYHPHGESVIYPTLTRMAQHWNTRYTLVDGQGNFGSINPDPAAAMRYTEARMTGAATELLDDLEKDTVEMVKNYDETRNEPTVLPGRFPNLLVNGSQGIAVGMATQIPPHNLGEICDALVHLIENPECTVQELMQHVKGPDFPTGGMICGRQGIYDAYTTGRGHLTLRAKVHFEEEKDREKIVVDEIPYQLGLIRLCEKIVESVKGDRIKGISDVRDESSKEGLRVVIELKRGENRDVVLNQLYKYTPLEATFAVNTLALVRGRPRILNLKQLLEQYREHRKDVITRRTRYLLAQAEEHAHILEGKIIAVDHIDEVIKIIRASKDRELAKENLIARFELTPRQAKAIIEMTLGALTGLERDKLKAEYEQVQEQIRDYQSILSDINRVLEIIKEDLYEMKEKFGDERRTIIVGEAGDFSETDLVADEVMAVTISHKGYCKREPLASYRLQSRGGKGIIGARSKDEEDFPEHLFIASTHDYLLFFTNDGRVYWQKVYDLPQLGRMSQGRALVNLLELQEGQKVVAIVPVTNFDEDASVFIVSVQGYMKKCRLSEYKNPRRGGISTMGLEEGDQVMAAKFVKRGQEVVLCTRQGMAVRIDETVVRDMGRSARGVNGPNLQEDDKIVSVVVGQPGDYLLTVCEKGVGKRSQIDEYRKTATQRAKGVINVKITEKNGPVVAVIAVKSGDELMLMAEKGKVIRTKIDDVRETGRSAVGVYLMDLEDDDRVVTVAKIAAEDAEAAHEQAAARKAEEQEEKEQREGSGRRKASESQAQQLAVQAPPPEEVSGDGTPKAPPPPETPQPLPGSVQEMLRRAEDEQKQKENGEQGGEKKDGEEGKA
ncbi:MAG TPA: DNA gyrase subunit A [Planctomycetota bacterium]|nr:DNA gyrase subunit A [Planctomycetota bacterium]